MPRVISSRRTTCYVFLAVIVDVELDHLSPRVWSRNKSKDHDKRTLPPVAQPEDCSMSLGLFKTSTYLLTKSRGFWDRGKEKKEKNVRLFQRAMQRSS